MTEEIFKPLALHTAGFGTPIKLDPQNQPTGHYGDSRTPHPEDFPEYMAPTGVIHLSIKDWARFILLHLEIDIKSKVHFDSITLSTLHSPPDSATWRFHKCGFLQVLNIF